MLMQLKFNAPSVQNVCHQTYVINLVQVHSAIGLIVNFG